MWPPLTFCSSFDLSRRTTSLHGLWWRPGDKAGARDLVLELPPGGWLCAIHRSGTCACMHSCACTFGSVSACVGFSRRQGHLKCSCAQGHYLHANSPTLNNHTTSTSLFPYKKCTSQGSWHNCAWILHLHEIQVFVGPGADIPRESCRTVHTAPPRSAPTTAEPGSYTWPPGIPTVPPRQPNITVVPTEVPTVPPALSSTQPYQSMHVHTCTYAYVHAWCLMSQDGSAIHSHTIVRRFLQHD